MPVIQKTKYAVLGHHPIYTRREAATFIPHYNSHFFSLLQFFLKSAILNA